MIAKPSEGSAFEAVRQLGRRRAPGPACELCGAPLGEEHAHLLAPAKREIKCCCDACAILFSGQQNGHFERVPERLHPRGRADILDLALKGRLATVAAIEQDYENRIHVAVTVNEDPGRDFGQEGRIGHRFFFSLEEIELVAAATG
jgi:hypothetical protein